MKFAVEVELGNDAMRRPSEVSYAIHKALVDSPLSIFDPVTEPAGGKVLDQFGNVVGEWSITDEEVLT